MHIMREIDIFYNTFNARHLNPEEVAETFIWSDNFEKLIQNNHSVVLGARGCGKTTLMKMLTIPALRSWDNLNDSRISASIKFFAIYISTDIYWDVKNQVYSSQLEKFGSFSQLVSEFSVNTNVFKSVCQTFKEVIALSDLEGKTEKELELCKLLIVAWKLPGTIPTLDYIIDALNLRVDMVNQMIQGLIFNYKDASDLPNDDFFKLSFESSLEYIIPVFQRIFKVDLKKKWAFCFDELEFAPNWLQKKLFGSLRSRNQIILYKLSASPILPKELEELIFSEYGPTPGNDLQIIKMWGSKKNEDFSKRLIDSIVRKKFPNLSAESFFGTNSIYNRQPNSYIQGSDFYLQMVQLLKKDKSFEIFLKENGVDISKPLPENDSQKDTLFRKIKPIVYFRNFYLKTKKEDVNATKGRGRKTSELYFGLEVLKKVCDGNPRWLIGLVTAILSRSEDAKADSRIQFDELLSTSKRFCNVIENIPINRYSKTTFKQLLTKVGKYFEDQVLGQTFHMDPRGTFIVDVGNSVSADHVMEILEKGVSQGAFIPVDPTDDEFDFKIEGKRLKLSYLLCVLFKLPLRKYPEASLKDILQGKSKSTELDDPESQLRIF
ncbi:hypothetical protein N824_21230 [Pedobacter sp. V48]|nr:hypothetical protein N824_21230 [Pedobacter sp. V48]